MKNIICIRVDDAQMHLALKMETIIERFFFTVLKVNEVIILQEKKFTLKS